MNNKCLDSHTMGKHLRHFHHLKQKKMVILCCSVFVKEQLNFDLLFLYIWDR